MWGKAERKTHTHTQKKIALLTRLSTNFVWKWSVVTTQNHTALSEKRITRDRGGGEWMDGLRLTSSSEYTD